MKKVAVVIALASLGFGYYKYQEKKKEETTSPKSKKKVEDNLQDTGRIMA